MNREIYCRKLERMEKMKEKKIHELTTALKPN